MVAQLRRLWDLRRMVEVEVPEIAYETDSGILIEWRQQNAWLPKSRIRIRKTDDSVIVKIPKSLYDIKF